MYIQVDTTLPGHPKLKKLARTLGVSRPTAIGHLNALWCWAATYAPDGDLSAYLNDEDAIADAAMWEGDAHLFVAALLDAHFDDESAGFLEVTADGALILHDWQDYFGRLIEKRQADAGRKRRERETAKGPAAESSEPNPEQYPQQDTGQAPDVRVTSNGRPTDAARMSALNVTKRSVNVTKRSVAKRNNNDDGVTTRARAKHTPDPNAAAAVFFDLAPQQFAALSCLLAAAPQFGDPVNFVRRNNPKLIAYWSLYVTSQPAERLQSIDNVGGLIAAYVKTGNYPNLRPDVRRKYEETVDRFLNAQDDPDIAEFVARFSGLSET